MNSATRAQFLTRGAKGGLALVAGGAILGLAEGTAFGAIPAPDLPTVLTAAKATAAVAPFLA